VIPPERGWSRGGVGVDAEDQGHEMREAQVTASRGQTGVGPATAPGKGEGHAHLSLGRVLRRHRWRIALGVVVGLSLGVLFGALTGPWYESTAQLLVIKNRLDTAPISGPSPEQRPDDYLSTHMLLIASPRVVERAVKKEKLETLPCFSRDGVVDRSKASLARLILGPGRPVTEQERVTDEIIDSLLVTRDAQRPGVTPSNEVLILTFRGKVGEDCRKVLRAVIASYEAFLRETYRDVSEETLKLVNQARGQMERDLKKKQADYEEFLTKTPTVSKGRDGTPDQARPFKIDEKVVALLERQTEIRASLKALEDALKNNRSEAEVLTLIAGVPVDKPLLPAAGDGGEGGARSTVQERLLTLQLEEKRLLLHYGPNHRAVRDVREEMKRLRAMIAPPPRTKLSDGTRALAEMKVRLLRKELEQAEGAEKSLRKVLKEGQEEAKAAALFAVRDQSYQQEIERLKTLYDSVVKRVQELTGVKDYGGFYTQQIAEPDPARWAIKKVLLVSGLSLFLGLLLGFGWAYRAEVADRSFRKPEEIRQALGWRVLAHVPHLRRVGKEAQVEAFRAVRTAVYFAAQADAKRVIQVTGPDQGSGKTTLTAHLAASIAQSGKRVLVMDADLRKPSQHKIYGVANDIGLTTVLAGRAGAKEAIRSGPVPGLDVLPSGPVVSNPAELLSSPALQTLLGSVREQYDYVLIDTPPLLAVTDPSIVAHQADGVLLVVRLTKRSRPDAQVAKEILEAAGADVLGVVVNGVPRRSGPNSPVYECSPLGLAYASPPA
jgi:polysaccharide biosynthesis transport protein